MSSVLEGRFFTSLASREDRDKTCLHMQFIVAFQFLSSVQLFVIPWTAAYQAPPPMGFSRQEYWSGLPLPSPTIGDWNAKVGSQETPGVTGKFGLGIQNEAGQRLIEFCQENALVIANTLFQQHKRRLYTWTSPDSQH